MNMTINTHTPAVQQTPPPPAPKAAVNPQTAAGKTPPPEDTVHLSGASKATPHDAAKGDPDHDGS